MAGCGSASTQYYFAAANLDDATKKPKVTFYRVTFEGSSFGAKSSLQQGFYDANALHELFGEVKKPDPPGKGSTNATSSAGAGKKQAAGVAAAPPAPRETVSTASGTYQLMYDFDTEQWTVTNQERFTIMYGANADEMANQIQLFAKNDKLGQQLGNILKQSMKTPKGTGKTPKPQPQPKPQPPTPSKLDQLKRQAADGIKGAATLAGQLDAIIKKIPDDKADTARADLREAAQDALAALGSKTKLDDQDLDKAFQQAENELKKLKRPK